MYSSSESNNHNGFILEEDGDMKMKNNNQLHSGRVRKDDFVRLVIQALNSLDFHKSAQMLEEESGIEYLSKDIKQLRQSILSGCWKESLNIVDQALNASNCKDKNLVKYHILKQKYLELLENGEVEEALKTLRNELCPIAPITSTNQIVDNNSTALQQLHTLTSLLLCSDAESLRKRAKWDGKTGLSRERLLEEIVSNIMVAFCTKQLFSKSMFLPVS